MKKNLICKLAILLCMGTMVVSCGNNDSDETSSAAESTVETTEEFVEVTQSPFVGIEKDFEEKDLLDKKYIYDEKGDRIEFILHKDGTYTYEGGGGYWELNRFTLTLTENIHTNGVGDKVNHFYRKDGDLLFEEEGSTYFVNIENIENGAIFYAVPIDEHDEPETEVDNPFGVIQETIETSDLVGKKYTYEGEGYGGVGEFVIEIHEDGTFTYNQGDIAAYWGYGKWEINGSIVTLKNENKISEDDESEINHFHMRNGHLIFIEEGSTQFLSIKTVQNGEVFYAERKI